MTATYNDLYLDTRKKLKKMGVESASLEARELICAASEKNREQFFRDLSKYAPDFVQEKLEDYLNRRIAGEPVAYLVGEWEFYGLPVKVTRDVLIPRTDSEVLADRAIQLLKAAGEGARLLDLCAGSGCIGLAVANHARDGRVVLLEQSAEAIQVCKDNIRKLKLVGKVACFQGDVTLDPDPSLWDFDVITCNPPYIPSGDIQGLDPSVRDYEPLVALDGGADGLDFYRAIAPKWASSLRLGGTILFEVGIGQAEAVSEILDKAGYVKIEVHEDTAGIPRVVEGSVPIG